MPFKRLCSLPVSVQAPSAVAGATSALDRLSCQFILELQSTQPSLQAVTAQAVLGPTRQMHMVTDRKSKVSLSQDSLGQSACIRSDYTL